MVRIVLILNHSVMKNKYVFLLLPIIIIILVCKFYAPFNLFKAGTPSIPQSSSQTPSTFAEPKKSSLSNDKNLQSPTELKQSRDINIDHVWRDWNEAEEYWRGIDKKRSKKIAFDSEDDFIKVVNIMKEKANKMAADGNHWNGQWTINEILEIGVDDADIWLYYADYCSATNNDWTNQEVVNQYLIAESRNPTTDQKLRIYRGLANLFTKPNLSRPDQAIIALEKYLKIQDDPDLRKKLSILKGQELVVSSIDTSSQENIPTVTLTFNNALAADGSIAYENFITVDPAIKFATIPLDKQLQLKGFEYGQKYKVTLKKGLPSVNNVKLTEDTLKEVIINNPDPALHFQSNAYILPRFSNLGIPLQGINVDVAQIEILHINERNLSSQINSRNIFGVLHDYSENEIRQKMGRAVWSGFINLVKVKNKSVTTALPFNEIIKDSQPGIYAVVARKAIHRKMLPIKDEFKSGYWDNQKITDKEYTVARYEEPVTQWLIVTDIGLVTYYANDGLTVIARSYQTGKPLPKTKIKLFSRDNTIISEGFTDATGSIMFPKNLLNGEGGRAVHIIQAYGQNNDFSFLNIRKASLDLSDFDITGRLLPKKIDIYNYSDRDIYRPGETVHFCSLLRDLKSRAITDAPPLTLKIMRPNGTFFKEILVSNNNQSLASYYQPITLPHDAARGVWHIKVFTDPSEPEVADYSFQVEDFLPVRIDLRLELAKDSALGLKDALTIPVVANYLYGSPVKHAKGEAIYKLQIAKKVPFLKYPDYRFGLLNSTFVSDFKHIKIKDTDDNGRTDLAIILEEAPVSSAPLEASIQVSVFDDNGRAVNRTAILPVHRSEPYLGIKSIHNVQELSDSWDFSGDRKYNLVAVDGAGNAVAQQGLSYQLVKEVHRHNWYSHQNDHNYYNDIYETPVQVGRIDIIPGQHTTLSFTSLKEGSYKLKVFNPTQVAHQLTAVSTRFNVGWTQSLAGAKDKPDSIKLHLDKEKYRVDDTAQLFIQAPFEGQVEIAIANENIMSRQLIMIPSSGKKIDIKLKKEWGAGVYILVSAYRAGDKIIAGDKSKQGPGRAMGAIWLNVDSAPRTLQVNISPPDVTRSKQTLLIPIQIVGGNQAEITVAVVDEGILQLTDFKTPAPDQYFYGKYSLPINIHDTYNRLIDPHVDAMGQVRVGGGMASRSSANLPNRWIKPLAMFSGPIKLDSQGKAIVPIEIPEFNGKVRIMAVAYDADKVGHGQATVTIQDPVIVNFGLPRFLALNDTTHARLNLDNLSGPTGQATIKITSQGNIRIGNYPESVTLDAKKKQHITVDLTAMRLGNDTLKVEIVFPDGSTYHHDWPIAVRSSQNYRNRTTVGFLKPTETLTLTDKLFDNIDVHGASVILAFNGLPDMKLLSVVKDLQNFPFSCVEQVTSKLTPLIYLKDIAQHIAQKDNSITTPLETINRAIQHIINLQLPNGSYSMWDGETQSNPFITLYVIDVLQRAQMQGYDVPEYVSQKSINWLKDQRRNGEFTPQIMHRRAYIVYLLARAGILEATDIRYFVERFENEFKNQLTFALTAAALSQVGDHDEATRFWEKAFKQSDPETDYDYGSQLRNNLITLTLAAEAHYDSAKVMTFAQDIHRDIVNKSNLSTQEQGWIVLAAQALYKSMSPQDIIINGAKPEATIMGSVLYNWQGSTLSQINSNGIKFTNDSPSPLYYTITTNALSKVVEPEQATGFKVTRQFYTRDGKEVDLNAINAGDMLIAVIEGTVLNEKIKDQVLISDLIPAGFEIENSKFASGQDGTDYQWTGELTKADYQQAEDDRFVLAFDPKIVLDKSVTSTSDGDAVTPKPLKANAFRFAYSVRAVTPGIYTLPALFTQAMYQPDQFALTKVGQITIK